MRGDRSRADAIYDSVAALLRLAVDPNAALAEIDNPIFRDGVAGIE